MKRSNIVIIVGYPKSGNTWLTWLIADALDSPIGALKGNLPLATEPEPRSGDYFVVQQHLFPVYEDNDVFMKSHARINMHRWSGEKIIHIMRDPRDVSVAVKYYWNRKTIRDAIEVVATGKDVFGKSWAEFVKAWQGCFYPVTSAFYESLSDHPEIELKFILERAELPVPSDKKIKEIVERNSFKVKRKQIEKDGDRRPYGKLTQLSNLRKGIVGDWKNEFTRADGKYAHEMFGDWILNLGYDTEANWWASLPEKR